MLPKSLLETSPKLTLRERLLSGKLAQVEQALAVKTDELQTLLRVGLSPAKIDQRQFELDALRDLKANLQNGLETVARQNVATVAGDEEEEETRTIGPWRTQRAFLDNLQRERVKLAALSRNQWSSAKATAAKRSRRIKWDDVSPGVNLNYQDVEKEEHPSWYSAKEGVVRSYMFAKETLTGIDPCIEQKKVRREVMFAQRSAGIGYRTRHEWKPC